MDFLLSVQLHFTINHKKIDGNSVVFTVPVDFHFGRFY